VAGTQDVDELFYELTRTASKVLTRGRILVEEDEHGSHVAVAVEVPIEAIRALAETVEEARELLRSSGRRAA
jgi:hypothetical protein